MWASDNMNTTTHTLTTITIMIELSGRGAGRWCKRCGGWNKTLHHRNILLHAGLATTRDGGKHEWWAQLLASHGRTQTIRFFESTVPVSFNLVEMTSKKSWRLDRFSGIILQTSSFCKRLFQKPLGSSFDRFLELYAPEFQLTQFKAHIEAL